MEAFIMNPNGNILIATPTLGLPADPFTYQAMLLKVLNQIQARKMGLAYLPVYRQARRDRALFHAIGLRKIWFGMTLTRRRGGA